MIYDKTIRKYVYFRDGGRCFYCGRRLSLRNFTLDHFLPRAAGGGDGVFNLVTCCGSCNEIKGAALPEDGAELMAELFIRAVEDGFITGGDAAKLRPHLHGITKVTVLAGRTVFEGPGFRVQVRENRIERVTFMSDGGERG